MADRIISREGAVVLRVTRKNKNNLTVECTTCKCVGRLSLETVESLMHLPKGTVELKLEATLPPSNVTGAVSSSDGDTSGGPKIIDIGKKDVRPSKTVPYPKIIDRGEGTVRYSSRSLGQGPKSVGKKPGGALGATGGKLPSVPTKPNKGGASAGTHGKSRTTSYKPSGWSGTKGGSFPGGSSGRGRR